MREKARREAEERKRVKTQGLMSSLLSSDKVIVPYCFFVVDGCYEGGISFHLILLFLSSSVRGKLKLKLTTHSTYFHTRRGPIYLKFIRNPAALATGVSFNSRSSDN